MSFLFTSMTGGVSLTTNYAGNASMGAKEDAALLSLFIFIVKFVTISAQIPLFTGGVVLAAIQIFLCSPIDNEARKLSEKETVTFRTVARVMVIVFLAVYVILTCVKQWRFSVPVGAGIIITALLQLPCLFTRKRSAT